ncbi:bifunctional heptose 7-phosphate kinase/heptose 1-phosphate adenyltransferase [Bacteroidota bacterium]
MKNSDLNKIFSQFDNFNILIIGDVMIDRYLWGKVDRISPEAPVPIVSCSLQEDRLGGAANVALNIKAMGATPFLCGITGTDKESFLFIELMDSEKLNTEGILSSENRKTTSKTRIISKNQQLLRIDKENDESVSEYIEKEFLHMVFSLMNKHNIHALIFEDYDKGTLTENIIEQIVKKAKEINIPVLVDPKKRNFLSYKNVTLFKPNIKELKEGLKIELNKNDIHELQKTTNILKENSDYTI